MDGEVEGGGGFVADNRTGKGKGGKRLKVEAGEGV